MDYGGVARACSELPMISAKQAIALADRSDNPSPFALVHRAVATMRESAAEPVEYADDCTPSPQQEEAFYLAEEAMALQEQQEEGELQETLECCS